MSTPKEAKSFSRSFTHLLKRAVQYSSHLYMEEVGKSGLTHRQFTVLSAVDTLEGKSQTELVKLTGIDRSTLADLVARLMEQGHLQRKRSKDDARANAVRLTPVGKKSLRMAQGGADDIDRKLLAHFGTGDRRVVAECLTVLAAEMDKIDSSPESETREKSKPRQKRVG